jgi:hypothetical protein
MIAGLGFAQKDHVERGSVSGNLGGQKHRKDYHVVENFQVSDEVKKAAELTKGVWSQRSEVPIFIGEDSHGPVGYVLMEGLLRVARLVEIGILLKVN